MRIIKGKLLVIKLILKFELYNTYFKYITFESQYAS